VVRLRRRDRPVLVLLHGAWHHGGHWNHVARHLRRRGWDVHAPTVPGHGRRPSRYAVSSIIGYLDDHDLTDFVLRGHGLVGTYLCKIAEELPNRIRRLIFHNAFVLQSGNSVLDELPPAHRGLIRQRTYDGVFLPPLPIWRERFMNDTNLRRASRVYAQLTPTPVSLFTEQLDLTLFDKMLTAGEFCSSYLNALDDTALPPGRYGWHPRHSERLGIYRLVQMPGSHEALFTRPRELASKIIQAARD
jgi:pimeloyl-ACP methyl ester carboxylesterase